MRLLLASASPRRRELLDAAGFACDVDAAHVDEQRVGDEAPAPYVERVARLKAAAGAAKYPDRIVVAADTIVTIDGDILGKPADDADARRMLRRLSGQRHDVLTAVVIARGAVRHAAVERTAVWFTPLTDEDIQWYVATGEPRDKAGAYAIQGRASRFIPRIDGEYANVVGLPIARLAGMLAKITEEAGRPPGPRS